MTKYLQNYWQQMLTRQTEILTLMTLMIQISHVITGSKFLPLKGKLQIHIKVCFQVLMSSTADFFKRSIKPLVLEGAV